MEKLVEIFPNQLRLSPSKNSTFVESKIKIKNLSDSYIIYKIFSNNKGIYTVKPSKSFILPKETKDIHIKRFCKSEYSSNAGKEAFILIIYTINKIINNNDEAKEAFDSKLYNHASKQEAVIPVIFNDNNNDDTVQENKYNENDLNEIGDNVQKEIKIYTNLIDNLKNEYKKINDNIINLEKLFDMIKTQIQLMNEKYKALKISKNNYKNNFNEIRKNLILISVILLGLIIGANLACKYNDFFFHKKRIIKQIIINQSENFIEKRINEINNINTNKSMFVDRDFLTGKFFLALYFFLLIFVI